ncbi:arginase [Bacillaceae bacterium W0354]
MDNKIGIIGAPITIAQPNYGVDLGPKAIRYGGLIDHLKMLNIDFEDYGDVEVPTDGTDEIDPVTNLKNLEKVAQGNEAIAKKVQEIHEKGEFPLILGGDHSIAIGTIAGIHSFYNNLGVIWYDAHADLNSGETSPSGNIHGMSLAANLGVGHDRLTSINGKKQKIKPENIVIIGARSIDKGEKKFIKENGIKVYTMHDIAKIGMERVMSESIQYLKERTDGVHLSFDVDGLDPLYTPGTGTPVPGGISFRETQFAMQMLHEANILTSAEFVEVNPLIDHHNETAEITAHIISTLLGDTYL